MIHSLCFIKLIYKYIETFITHANQQLKTSSDS